MAKPQIFVSSTFYDLKHIRSSVEVFIERLGYEPILSDKGKIAYDPDIPLDASCYRTASEADMFVLIIGGRYGSETSEEQSVDKTNFYERYESVTKKEYEAALSKDIPIYILIDRSVYNEYETFKKNRENTSIEYAHVDSVNVFKMLDLILSKRKNNPFQLFDKYADIEPWLREQWAGLFRELINRRSERKQISSLSDRVDALAEINNSLQRYLEQVVKVTSPENGSQIVDAEKQKLLEYKQRKELEGLTLAYELIHMYEIPIDDIINCYKNTDTINGFGFEVDKLLKHEPGTSAVYWGSIEGYTEKILLEFNEGRRILNLDPAVSD